MYSRKIAVPPDGGGIGLIQFVFFFFLISLFQFCFGLKHLFLTFYLFKQIFEKMETYLSKIGLLLMVQTLQ
jgi:hypothetical protein